MTGPFSRKQIQQQREAYILEVTEALLKEKGYYDMSMDEIAARVGITKVTLYRHFKSKEDLIFHLLFGDLPSFLQHLDEKISTDLPVIEQIESFIYRSILNFLQKNSSLSLSFLSSLGELSIFLKSKQKDLQQVEDTIAEYFIPLLKDGQSEGLIDSTVPPSILLGTLSGIISSVSLQQMKTENDLSEEELADIGTRLYMKAIRA
ncbi:TetR/AcrR family transcriptional regulator [Virgibacillus xinjiangensis]|uniref:TetR/AcrR family transcriptional regulator n=1 Tax=Virgibacillus xinjiangensis TaxID=393090 RepID=A0ABV7CQI6_9BACI